MLLEERDQEVGGEHDLGDNLVLLHLDVTNSNSQAENLLKLELDGRSDLSNLGNKVLIVRNRGRELTSLGKLGTQETGNLLDESLGSNESVVLLGKLLDELLVLVELLKILNRHGINTSSLSTVDIDGVTKDTDGHVRTGDLGKLDGTRETLISLGVVVLESDLELNGLQEVSLLGLRGGQKVLNVLTNVGVSDLRHCC